MARRDAGCDAGRVLHIDSISANRAWFTAHRYFAAAKARNDVLVHLDDDLLPGEATLSTALDPIPLTRHRPPNRHPNWHPNRPPNRHPNWHPNWYLKPASQLAPQLKLQLDLKLKLQLDLKLQLNPQLKLQLNPQLKLQLNPKLKLKLNPQLKLKLNPQLKLQLRSVPCAPCVDRTTRRQRGA